MAKSLFDELKRRNVFKAVTGYAVLCWLVLQIADVVVPALKLPEWTMTFLVVIALIGFPFVMIFSWVYEITSEGVKKTTEIDSAESVTYQTGKKLEYAIIAGLVLAVIILLVKPSLIPTANIDGIASNDDEIVTAVDSTPSIAVLPFEDFSPEKDQEYFSSGISEEILNLLAKNNSLRVAARTSSFAFRDQNQDIKTIGKKLNVSTVLEGSIRKFEDKVRITAQLINVDDGYHIWSETYDRELKDIFALQDEIASSILTSLESHLLGDQQLTDKQPLQTPQKYVQDNIEAYELYLKANELLLKQERQSVYDAVMTYREALKLDPSYVDAKIKLVLASLHYERFLLNPSQRLEYSNQNDALVNRYMTSLKTSAEHNAEFNAVMGFYHLTRYEYEIAKDYLNNALNLHKNYAQAYKWRADLHYTEHNYLAMLADREKAYELDPMSIDIARALAYDYRSFWRPGDAQKIIDQLFERYPNHPDAFSAKATNYTSHGRYADAAITLEQAIEVHPDMQSFKGWLTWLYLYLEKNDKAKAQGVSWVEYYIERKKGNYQQAQKLLNEQIKTPEDRLSWISFEMDLYLASGNRSKLKEVLEYRLNMFEQQNIPWQSYCQPYVMAAMQETGMTDSFDTMLDNCRETTEESLKAGYLCPCSWFQLVTYAILDERFDDAIKRAQEWLTNGDSNQLLDTDPLFSRLKNQPKYQLLLKRNREQINKQVALYDKLSIKQLSNKEPASNGNQKGNYADSNNR